ncbi:hypothetical protein DIPPA_09931 [Diplonema papillatum]|nr:hypothetical protein DIPPA_09931 [Diplonema papillatum]
MRVVSQLSLLVGWTTAVGAQSDCADLSIKWEPDNDILEPCPEGTVLASRHELDACLTEICSTMNTSSSVIFDSEDKALKRDSAGNCAFATRSGNVEEYVCGPAPPYTLYQLNYDADMFPAYHYMYDVELAASDSDYVYTAGSYELSVLKLKSDGGFEKVGRQSRGFYGLHLSLSVPDRLYAARSNGLEVLDMSVKTLPVSLSFTTVAAYSCDGLHELQKGTTTYIYMGCYNFGLFCFDVTDGENVKLLNDGDAILPSEGTTEGLVIDHDRKLMFVSGSAGHIGMYTVDDDPTKPSLVHERETNTSAYQMMLEGSVLYVTAVTIIEIFETNTNELVPLSTCCSTGPALYVIGIFKYEGLLYLSDWFGRVDVVNATDVNDPFYVGHRALPAGTYGYSYAREGVTVAKMSDGVTRVFVAAYEAGLSIFSDVPPPATPLPATMLPVPPPTAFDCSTVSYSKLAYTAPMDCPKGKSLISEHPFDMCKDDICSSIQEGELVAFDSQQTYQLIFKVNGVCDIVDNYVDLPTSALCGTPAPYTTYVEPHPDVLLPGAFTRTLATAGKDNDLVVIGTSVGLSVVKLEEGTSTFKTVAHVQAAEYYSVVGDRLDTEVAYGSTRTCTLNIHSLAPPEETKIVGTLQISTPGNTCYAMMSYSKGTKRIVYMSAYKDGFYGVDVSKKDAPKLLGTGVLAQPLTGNARGIVIDYDRDLLFLGTTSDGHALYMYDNKDPTKPSLIASKPTDGSAFHLALDGTLLHIAADLSLETWETKDSELVHLSRCCSYMPTNVYLVGLSFFGGMAYLADNSGYLVIVNVTDPYNPYYQGHRAVPTPDEAIGMAYPSEGIAVVQMGDGIVRVLLSGGFGGLMVYSDVEPAPTPVPSTPAPPPPMVPPDCSTLYIQQQTTNGDPLCKEGDVLASKYAIDPCNPGKFCGLLNLTWLVGYDGAKPFTKDNKGNCFEADTDESYDRYVCMPTPQHTKYLDEYADGVFMDWSSTNDVAVLSDETVVVATTREVAYMAQQENGRLKKIARLPNGCYALAAKLDEKFVVYALRYNYLEAILIQNPLRIASQAMLNGYGCTDVEQYKRRGIHVVYVSCPSYGIYAVNTTFDDDINSFSGAPVAKPQTGRSGETVKGLLVDRNRGLLFAATGGSSSGAFHMYNVAGNPQAPVFMHTDETPFAVYSMILVGTKVYAAAEANMHIYETTGGKVVELTFCCNFGPELHLRGLAILNGIVYASDYHGKLIVMDVTDEDSPQYIGHRDLPSTSSGNSNGKEGITIATMKDDVVRVFVAGDAGGLLVFSDVKPAPTPAPNTMMPAPPAKPLDCSAIKVSENEKCELGTVLENEHMVSGCLTGLCAQLSEGVLYKIDGWFGQYVTKTGTTCAVNWPNDADAVIKALCGQAPPHTTYVEINKKVLPFQAYTRDLAVLGTTRKEIVVATNVGLAVLTSDDSVGFIAAGDPIDGDYFSVIAAEHNLNIAYAVKYLGFDIVSLSPPESASKIGSLNIASYYCVQLEQYRLGTNSHVVYLSCGQDGVYAVDVASDTNPVLLNDGHPVLSTVTGSTNGITVDEPRKLLFVVTADSSDGAVHMYDLSDPKTPKEKASEPTDHAAHELVVSGTIVYIAAGAKLEVYETADLTFVSMGWCCKQPQLNLVGLTVYDGLLYGSDAGQMMVTINVTEPSDIYYAGHRSLANVGNDWAGGRNGIHVGRLKDGVVRVFQAVGYAGLAVYSDALPAPSPAPDTRAPPPPIVPPDCSTMYPNTPAQGESPCPEGHVLLSKHVIDACNDVLCDKISGSVGFDSLAGEVYKKSDSSCSFDDPSGTISTYMCGPAPPYTTYMVSYKDSFFPDYSRLYDVLLLKDQKHVMVGNSYDLTVLKFMDNGHLKRVGTLYWYYSQIIVSEKNTDLMYGIMPYYLDVFDISDPANPFLYSTVYNYQYNCDRLVQITTGNGHYCYASCSWSGVHVYNMEGTSPTQDGTKTFYPAIGTPKGLVADGARELLFLAVDDWDNPGVYMYDVTTLDTPKEKDFQATHFSAFNMELVDTLLYVAAKDRLHIFGTTGGAFSDLGWCCVTGPEMYLVGLEYYQGLVYGSDYNGKLLVMNVSDSAIPFYLGHKELPDAPTKRGQMGVHVARFADDVIRVLQCTYDSGLVVFSDKIPEATPLPSTPVPVPPAPPLDCSSYTVMPRTATQACPEGMVMATDHILNQCNTELCESLETDMKVSFDATNTQYMFTKYSWGSCSVDYFWGDVPTHSVCGPAPPHTTYLEYHKNEVLVDEALGLDVAILGSDSNDILVATTEGLTMLHAQHSTGFTRTAHIDGYYPAVLAAQGQPDIAYALLPDGLDIINLQIMNNPDVLATTTFTSTDSCNCMTQMRTQRDDRYVFVGCGNDGILLVDVRNNKAPRVNGSLQLTTGTVRAVTADNSRSLLFVSASSGTGTASTGTIYMYNMMDVRNPIMWQSLPVTSPARGSVLVGTMLYVAAQTKLQVYTTSTLSIENVGWCCVEGPALYLVGVTHFDGFLYASDLNQKMIILNATGDPNLPYFAGHRQLPAVDFYWSNGEPGIVAAPLGDGIVRVFQAAGRGGLMVFSDEKPNPTPSPPTPLPPPPVIPPDCSQFYFHDNFTWGQGSVCEPGDTVIGEHIIELCMTDICAVMVDGISYLFDGAVNTVYRKTGSICEQVEIPEGGPETRSFVCGPGLPNAKYRQAYDKDFLPDYGRAVDVAVLGVTEATRSHVVVATTLGLSVLQLTDSGNFQKVGSSTGVYVSLLTASDLRTTVYGLKANGLDILTFEDPTKPKILGSVSFQAFDCAALEQFVVPGMFRMILVGCGKDAYIVDALTLTAPIVPAGSAIEDIFVRHSNGAIKAMAVDMQNQVVYVGTVGDPEDRSLIVVDASNPMQAHLRTTMPSDYSLHSFDLNGNLLYAAAESRVEVFTVDGGNPVLVSHCCEAGPELHVLGVAFYNGILYASDWYGRLMVVNVTVPTQTYYMGNRWLPSASGNSQGKEGLVVSKMRDHVVRVFQAADNGGLMVFSDMPPTDTPSPRTRSPPLPPRTLDCRTLFRQPKAEGKRDCPSDLVQVNKDAVDFCLEALCDKMSDGDVCEYDGDGQQLKKERDSCSFGAGTSTHSICGLPPPHTMYADVHTQDVIRGGAKTRDVVSLGSDRNDVAVATSTGIAVLVSTHSTGLEYNGFISGNYYAVLRARHDRDLLYGLRGNGLDVISLTPPTSPVIMGSVNLQTTQCRSLVQMTTWGGHVLYLSCMAGGVFAIDVVDDNDPHVITSNITLPGAAKGLAVESTLGLLIIGVDGYTTESHGVYMYDVGLKPSATYLDTAPLDYAAYDLDISGTMVVVAAFATLEVYDTVGKVFKPMASCCQDAPQFQLVGLDVYQSLVYASDMSGRLVVVNMTTPDDMVYLGHRNLEVIGAQGTSGIDATRLGDGIVRVFQTGGSGLFVFSDVPPEIAPPLPTPTPPAPKQGPDCSALYVYDAKDSAQVCENGDVLMPAFIVGNCPSVCDLIADGAQVMFDGLPGTRWARVNGVCSAQASTTIGTQQVCGPPPPLTAEMQTYRSGFIPYASAAVDVASFGTVSRGVAVAGTQELTVFKPRSDGTFSAVSSVATRYETVMSAGDNLVFALNLHKLDFINLAVDGNPQLTSISFNSHQCTSLTQLVKSDGHIVYVGCSGDGVFAVSPTGSTMVALNGGDPVVKLQQGETVTAIESAILTEVLYMGYQSGSTTELRAVLTHKLDNTNMVSSVATDGAVNGIMLVGTEVFAATNTLEVFRFAGILTRFSTCCSDVPTTAPITGLDYSSGLVFAPTTRGALLVYNVTDPENPAYIGSRALPAGAGEATQSMGLVVAELGDMLSRVIVAAGYGGLGVYSDVALRPTNSPAGKPPPTVTTCADVAVFEKAVSPACPPGSVLADAAKVGVCSMCDGLPEGAVVKVSGGSFVKRVDGGCQTTKTVAAADAFDRILCAPAPPYVSQMNTFKGMFPSNPVQMAVVGGDRRQFVIATGKDATLYSQANEGVTKSAAVDVSVGVVKTAAQNPNIVYAISEKLFHVLAVSDALRPVGSTALTSPCTDLSQFYRPDGTNIVYTLCSGSITPVDVSNPRLPIASSSIAEAEYTALVVHSGLQFLLATGPSKLYAYNISEPTAPQLVSQTDLPDTPTSATLSGTTVYMGSAAGVMAVDVAQAVPAVVQAATPASVLDVAAYGGLLFAVDTSLSTVVMNISTPAMVPLGASNALAADGTAADVASIVVSPFGTRGEVHVFQTSPMGMIVRSDAPDIGLAAASCSDLKLSPPDNRVCLVGTELAARGDLEGCWAGVCAKLAVSQSFAFAEAGFVVTKDTAGICSFVPATTDERTEALAMCKPVASVTQDPTVPTTPTDIPGPPRGAATEEPADDGLLLAAIIGPVAIAVICLLILAGGYVYVKRASSAALTEELQEFDFVKENGVDDQTLTDAELLQATVSQQSVSNYDKL